MPQRESAGGRSQSATRRTDSWWTADRVCACDSLLPDIVRWKPGTVNVHFNGAATTTGYVDVKAQSPGWMIYSSAGSAKFVPGQTDVQVPIKVDCEKPAQIPLKVSIRGSSAEFQTMTHYSGNR